MTLRGATVRDLEQILELDADAFGDQAWSRTAVQEELSGPTRTVLVAADPPDGWASTAVTGDVADLVRIGVRPAARRHGLARALLGGACAAASERGAARMLLEVATSNTSAVALYETSGFARIAQRRDYYGTGIDALVMERTL